MLSKVLNKSLHNKTSGIATKNIKPNVATSGKCVRFKLPHPTHPVNARTSGPYLPTKIFSCPHCGSGYSSLTAQRYHMQRKHPAQYHKWQVERQLAGDKRIKLQANTSSDPTKVLPNVPTNVPKTKVLPTALLLRVSGFRSSRSRSRIHQRKH